jgi:hypothetical protein
MFSFGVFIQIFFCDAAVHPTLWNKFTPSPPFSPRSAPILSFSNTIYLIGGLGDQPFSDVWSSGNGNDWALVASNVEALQRANGHAHVLNEKCGCLVV